MSIKTLCKGMAVGAALMYFFDPKEGKYRRQAIRDGVNTCVETTEHAWCAATERVTDVSRTVADQAQSLLPDKKKGSSLNRILTGAAGGAMAAYALKKPGVLGTTLGAVGWNMVAQGFKTANKKSRSWIQ